MTADENLPVIELATPGPLRDSGLAAILAGDKTAMTGRLQIHEHAGDRDEFARAEGRGYADAAQWRAAHEEFFCSEPVALFLGCAPHIDDNTLVITERFRLVQPVNPEAGAV